MTHPLSGTWTGAKRYAFIQGDFALEQPDGTFEFVIDDRGNLLPDSVHHQADSTDVRLIGRVRLEPPTAIIFAHASTPTRLYSGHVVSDEGGVKRLAGFFRGQPGLLEFQEEGTWVATKP